MSTREDTLYCLLAGGSAASLPGSDLVDGASVKTAHGFFCYVSSGLWVLTSVTLVASLLYVAMQ